MLVWSMREKLLGLRWILDFLLFISTKISTFNQNIKKIKNTWQFKLLSLYLLRHLSHSTQSSSSSLAGGYLRCSAKKIPQHEHSIFCSVSEEIKKKSTFYAIKSITNIHCQLTILTVFDFSINAKNSFTCNFLIQLWIIKNVVREINCNWR